MSFSVNPASQQTKAVRAGICSDRDHGSVIPPLHLSTNFSFDGLGGKRRYDYSRSGNPTRDVLAEAIADLEGGEGAVVTSSGMAALNLIASLVKAGQRVLAPHDCYGGTFRLLNALAERGHFQVEFIDFGSLTDVEAALAAGAALAIVESPSNPLLRIVDLAAIGRLCRSYNTIYAVDNTFLSPALQQPIALGADLVIHSTTKYLNGHSDVVGGAVVARDKGLAEQLAWWANCTGSTGAPFDAYLTLRGIRTLGPRIRAHLENADAVAQLLAGHAAVSRVHYPGLESHPGHLLAKTQQKGFGGIVSFELRGSRPQTEALINRLEHFTLAESLGGVESLIAHPASMTHASMTAEARERAGIRESLIRLSVGIESTEDLAADLRAGLDAAAATLPRSQVKSSVA